MELVKISRFIAYILRHHPEKVGLSIDEHGWADVNELVSKIQNRYPEFSIEHLEEIVREDNKQRYAFKVRTQDMSDAGHKFFLSQNGVWLVKSVPTEYLEIENIEKI